MDIDIHNLKYLGKSYYFMVDLKCPLYWLQLLN